MGDIYLVPPDSSDKDKFFRWRNEYNIYRWCRQAGPISETHHHKYWYLVDGCEDKKFWAVREVHDGGYITVGCAGLTDIDYLNRRAEFSLYIGSEHQNQGFGKRALTKLFEKGFNELNLNLIWGETFDGNPAMKMFKSLGMKEEGTRRSFYFKSGEYIDCHLFSLLASEWKK